MSPGTGGPGDGPPPEALAERLMDLQAGLEEIPDPVAREQASELVSVVLELYGEGLHRIFDAIEAHGEDAAELREELAADGVIGSLMLIHGLYPVSLDERVVEALDSVAPYLESHGGGVELLSVDDGIATIKLLGSCDGCPASSATLELAIKGALEEHAPDLEGVIVEGSEDAPAMAQVGGNELPMVQLGGTPDPAQDGERGSGTELPMAEALPPWTSLRDLEMPADRSFVVASIGGTDLIIASVEGSLLAYRDRCPGCGDGLAGGELDAGALACPGCRHRYLLPRAGRSIEDDRLQLAPVPLLADADGVRVALAT